MKKRLLPLLIVTAMGMTACCDCKPTRGRLADVSDSNGHTDKHNQHDDGHDNHGHDASHHEADHHDEHAGHDEHQGHHHDENHGNEKHHEADQTSHNDMESNQEDNQHSEASETMVGTDSTDATADSTAIELGRFDWSAVKNSQADIGHFPYFVTPEGMKLVVADGSAKEGQAVSKTLDDGKLNLFDNEKIVSEQGKLSYLNFIMGEEGQKFDRQKFDSSVSEYMKQIGAVEFYHDTLPTEVSEQIKALEGLNHEGYMTGDFGDRQLRQFAVNHDNGKLFYQVMSDENHGEVGVLEVEGFNPKKPEATEKTPPVADSTTESDKANDEEAVKEDTADKAVQETPQPPTASSLNKQITNSGRAVLNINFDVAKASVRENDQKIVDEIYTLLSNNPELKLSIEGHTDSSGDAEMNGFLSQARAEEVQKILVKKGIDKSRLKAKGFGESKPLVDNDTKENRAKNRRVELVKFD